jgi:hypothetical protein
MGTGSAMGALDNESNDLTVLCACCENPTLTERGGYEICGVCGWEDDPTQSEYPNMAGGANKLSLNQARAAWLANPRKRESC